MTIITKSTKQFSWAELKEAANMGALDTILCRGAQIPVTLKNGEEVVFDVTRDENGKIFFVAHDCLNDQHRMNKEWTNGGGWDACEMRAYLNSTVLALLPDEIQEVIAPTTIVQVLNGKRVESVDKLFLLSRTQVFGKGSYTKAEPDDTQLDIFLTERSRVKECGDNGTWFWWERSPNYGNTSTFCNVNSNGAADNSYVYYTCGVVPGFCI